MKTIFTTRLFAILILATAALTSAARDEGPIFEQIEADGVYYEVHDDKLEVIKHPQGYSGVVIIPETVMYGNNPYTVTTINSWAFRNCDGLLSVGISSTVNDIDIYTFFGCKLLEEIYVDPNNKTYASYDRALYDKAMTTILWCPQTVDETYEVAEGTTTIGADAFNECTMIETVILPETVNTIGSYAFKGCAALTNIKLPDGITAINDQTFYGCTALADINIPAGLKRIGLQAFAYCGIKEMHIPNHVTEINGWALQRCEKLERLTLPDNMTSIPEGLLSNCTSLSEIDIPQGITSIGKSAFSGCKSLKEVKLPDGVTSIETNIFWNCTNLESVNLPDDMTEIGRYFFTNCESLASIKLPQSLTEIGIYAFRNCKSLKEITIPANVTTIEYWAFNGCEALADVTNLSTVPQTIDEETFSNFGTLHVPAGSEQLYAQAEGWNKFNIVGDATVPDAIDNIEADKENATVRYYGIDGRMRQTETHQGITIVKTTDGKTRKVANKKR